MAKELCVDCGQNFVEGTGRQCGECIYTTKKFKVVEITFPKVIKIIKI